MLKCFDKINTTSAFSKIVTLAIMFTVLISADLTPVFKGAVDIFHQGELLGNYWHMLEYYRGQANFPVFIHGAMDYLPSLIAGYFFGDDKIIYGTRLIVVSITLLSCVIFTFIGIDILGRFNKNNIISLGFVAIFCFTLPLFNLEVMAIEESPVGLRDIFILLQFYFLFHFYITKERKPFYLIPVFFVLPLTLYWSYDRGVAAALACLVLLVYFIVSKRYLHFIIAMLSLTSSIIFFELTKVAGSITENLSNILYWAEASSEVWGVNIGINFAGMLSLFPLFFVVSVFSSIYYLKKDEQNDIPMGIVFIVFVIELILIKSAYNRPNIHRGLMSIWPAVLLFLWLVRSQIVITCKFGVENKTISKFAGWLARASLITLGIALIWFFVFNRGYLSNVALFKKTILTPPIDSVIAGNSLVQISDYLKGEHHSINMVNQGVITLLSKTSHGTKFPYLVYANKKSQSELIEIIKAADINTVIIESHDWSSAIDGRSMKSRIPQVYAFLTNSYKKEITIGNYLVLKREDN